MIYYADFSLPTRPTIVPINSDTFEWAAHQTSAISF